MKICNPDVTLLISINHVKYKFIIRLDPSIVAKSINMVNLSPKIQKMIVDADTPKAINREKLFGAIPDDWEKQEQRLLLESALE